MGPTPSDQFGFELETGNLVLWAWATTGVWVWGPFGISYPRNVYGGAMVSNGRTVLYGTFSFAGPLVFFRDDNVYFVKMPIFTFGEFMI